MTNTIQITFQELFYGSGAWLGLLLLLILLILLSLKVKFANLLTVPITIFLGIEYLSNDLMWHGFIMFLSSIFLILNLVRNE